MKSRYVAGAALIVTATLPVMSTSSVSADAKIGPGERRCFPVEGEPGDAAVVNLTPVQAEGAGNGKLISSDVVNPSESSNVNFQPGTADPNVAIAPIGQDGKVCYVNSNHTSVHLVADHLGTISGDVYEPGLPGGDPFRIMDTRQWRQLQPAEETCPIPDIANRVAFVNTTPINATGAGHGLVSRGIGSGKDLWASNVNYNVGTVDPNVAVVPLIPHGIDVDDPWPDDGSFLCYANSETASVDVVLDIMGTIDDDVFTPPNEWSVPERVMDTRGWEDGPFVEPDMGMCFTVEGEPGDVAIVNLTPVNADGLGDGQLVSGDVFEVPVASNVNFGPGTVNPNVAMAPIGQDGYLCFANSMHSKVDIIADHLGTIDAEVFTVASADGGSVRSLDTRG